MLRGFFCRISDCPGAGGEAPFVGAFSRLLTRQFSENPLLADVAIAVTIGVAFTALAFLLSGFSR